MMKRYLLVILTIIILSFYFFPFQFRFMPTVNTKMVLAGIGLLVVAVELGRSKNSMIDKDILIISGLAGFVSLAGLISVTYNDTNDFTYASYIVSMWVWLSAAYVVMTVMRSVHGEVSIFLLCNYLIGLCVVQCVLALAMEYYLPVKDFIYGIIDQGTASFLEKKDRLSGLGVGLDVAGSRFSSVLVMLAYVCVRYKEQVSKYSYLYVLAFCIISVVGNMIARTTSVGMIIAIVYFIVAAKLYELNVHSKRFLLSLLGVLMIAIPVLTYYYVNIPDFYQKVRFGFEGFFSLVEKGKWEVYSNEILQNMYVFPESLKTWLIGDGYFGATTLDPYYTGKEWRGFYMATDVGYLRFIFYFGLLGLFAFSFFMYRVAKVCMNRFSSHKLLFWMLLAINFIIWFKVSTDIFLVFALFLCIGKDDGDECQRRLLADNSL